MKTLKVLLSTLMIALTGLFLTACNDEQPEAEVAEAAAEVKPFEFYEAHVDGRINLFYNHELFREFIALGETPYRKTYIGEGPKGETLVYGLTKKDKKKTSGIPSIDLMQGSIEAPASFYGEMYLEGRIYVFDNYKQMVSVRTLGEPPYRYTMIGEGPKGETVVLVLRKENKKKKPEALLAAFNARNQH